MNDSRMRATCRLVAMLLIGSGFCLVGCSDKLETGYEPRPLRATAAERRAYYAPAFTPEAAAGLQDHGSDDLRPVTGRPGMSPYR